MNKIRFANDVEMEVASVTLAGDLNVEIETSDVNSVIAVFKNNAAATSVMRYYVEADLLRGYAGYTRMHGLSYTPNVVKEIDYNITDATTESGFAETRVDKVVVTMQKVSNTEQTEQLAAQVAALSNDVSNINAAMEG